jgi:hypothetical protein
MDESRSAQTMKLLYTGTAALIVAGCTSGASAPLTPLRVFACMNVLSTA